MSIQPHRAEIPDWTIAERLYVARTIRGFEMQQLADIIGISRDTVRNYENRFYSRKRSPLTIRAWARACDVDEPWLEHGIQARPDGPDGTIVTREKHSQPTALRLAA